MNMSSHIFSPYKSSPESEMSPDEIPSDIEIPIVLLICIFYTLLTLAISRYCTSINTSGNNIPWFHPSAVAALLGLLIGGITSTFNIVIRFNDDVFFYLVLPPIIFTAGYTLKKKKFFQYLHFIALYGIIGSLSNFILIAVSAYYYEGVTLSWTQALLLSSVLAANDEISAISLIKQSEFPRLGAMLFGEGVLNDALSIVLFQALLSSYRKSMSSQPALLSDDAIPSVEDNAFALVFPLIGSVTYQLVASCSIGLTCGLCNARILKVFSFSRKYPIHQTTFVMLTGYLAYSLAEVIDVSGILTLFVTAVTLAHYSWHSLSKTAKLSSKIAFVSLSDAAESFAFAYVGLSLWDVAKGPTINYSFSAYMLLVVFVSRFLTILTLASAYDLFSGRLSLTLQAKSLFEIIQFKPNIPFLELVAFTLGGLVRGCLCWAQVLQIGGGHDSSTRILVETTYVIVMVTTVGCGILLPLVLPRLTGMLLVAPNSSAKGSVKVKKRMSPNTFGSSIARVTMTTQEDFEDDESTYSMHLEGSVNDSDDEEFRHAKSINTGSYLRSVEGISSYQSPLREIDDNFHNSSSTPIKALNSSNEQRHHGVAKKYSLMFILWVRIDEHYMKPLFGGSNLDSKNGKSKALELTKSLRAYEMLSPVKTIVVEGDLDDDSEDESDAESKDQDISTSADGIEQIIRSLPQDGMISRDSSMTRLSYITAQSSSRNDKSVELVNTQNEEGYQSIGDSIPFNIIQQSISSGDVSESSKNRSYSAYENKINNFVNMTESKPLLSKR